MPTSRLVSMHSGDCLPGRRRWSLLAATLAAALGVVSWSCAAEQARDHPPQGLPVPEVRSASLSTDGQVIALGGPIAADSPMSLYVIDATAGKLVAQRTVGTTILGALVWGPGNSYLVPASQLRPGELHRVLYWSPAAAEAPHRLGSTAELWFGEASLDPTLQYAIISVITEARSPADIQASKALAVPLHGDLPPQVLLHTPYYVGSVGAVVDPENPGRSLALLLGPKEGPDAEPGMVAVEVPSGKVRWRARFDVSGVRGMVYELSAGQALLGLGRLDTSRGTPSARTEVWTVDTAKGTLRPIANVPQSPRFVTPVMRSGSDALVFIGAGGAIWRLDLASPSPNAEKVIEGSREVQPLGARLNAAGQGELFMYTAHAIWRCRPEAGTCEVFLGQPQADEGRPEFVRRGK